MNIYLLITFIIVLLFGFFLFKKKWKIKHIISLILSLGFIFIFSFYGDKLITPIWPTANAANLWLVMFFLIYGGSAIMGIIPFLIHKDKKEQRKKIIKIIKFWFAIGLIYVAIDNSTMGPFAVGPYSPYLGKSLCTLDPTYYSEDIFFGCIIEKMGINTVSELAVFLAYIFSTILLLISAGLIISYKRLERIMFVE